MTKNGSGESLLPSPARSRFSRMSTIPVLFAQKRCLGADVIVGRTETTTGMVLGVLAQPVPQCAVWALGRRCAGFVTLGSTLLPGDAAGEPFADRQHALEMTNSRPPALRA